MITTTSRYRQRARAPHTRTRRSRTCTQRHHRGPHRHITLTVATSGRFRPRPTAPCRTVLVRMCPPRPSWSQHLIRARRRATTSHFLTLPIYTITTTRRSMPRAPPAHRRRRLFYLLFLRIREILTCTALRTAAVHTIRALTLTATPTMGTPDTIVCAFDTFLGVPERRGEARRRRPVTSL